MVAALADDFEVLNLPLIEIAPPLDGGAALTTALADADRYDWIVVTSVNGAAAVIDRVLSDRQTLLSTSYAAIGERTADALIGEGLAVEFVPTKFEPDTFVREFPVPSGTGRRVLLARAEAASDVIPSGLRAKGWEVDDMVAYRSIGATPPTQLFAAATVADVVTFTAPSAVARFRELLGDRPCAAVIASIGPVTSEAVRAHGFTVAVEPEQHTVPDLVVALRAWAKAEG